MAASANGRLNGASKYFSTSCSMATVALACALAMPTAAIAQEAAAEAAPGEIIVTAQKRAQSINSVPMTITAASALQLEQAGVKEIGDLAKITPGLTFGQNNLGSPVITLRGVGYNDVAIATRPAVTVYLDEAPMPFGIEATGVGLDVERVEVLKGPQGTLFGANSTGGAINYIARKPTNTFEAGANFTYGRFNEADISGYVSGPVSDTLSVRVAAEHRGMGDWQRSFTRNDARGQRDFNNGRVSLLWKPSSNFRAQFTVSGWTDHGDTQATQLSNIAASAVPAVASRPLAPADARAADWNPNNSYRKNNNYVQTTLRMDYDLSSAVTLTSQTNYLKVNVNASVDADGTNVVAAENTQRGDSQTFSQELRLAGKFDSLNLLLGAAYTKDVTHDRIGSLIKDASAGAGLGFNQLDSVTNQNVDNYAVFGNAEYKIVDHLTLQGGARYTKSINNGSTCLGLDPGDGTASTGLANILNFGFRGVGTPGGPAALPAVAAGKCAAIDTATLTQQNDLLKLKLDEHNVSWRAGLQYEPARGSMVYANVSKGYKQGTLPIFGAPFVSEAIPVTQESVLSYEAGFKQSLFDHKLQLNGAVFYAKYNDKQVLGQTKDPFLGTTAALVNIPKSRIWGAEFQAILNPMTGLDLNVSGAYIDSKIQGSYIAPDATGVTRDMAGTVLPYAPKWQLSAAAHYEWALKTNLNAFVGANVSYQSVSYGNIGALKLLEIKPYALTDLQAGVEGNDGQWRAYVWGRNVFNKYYWSNVAKLIDTTNRWTGLPATYGVTVAFKFH